MSEVVVSEAEYMYLISSDIFLSALFHVGVDKWEKFVEAKEVMQNWISNVDEMIIKDDFLDEDL